MSQIEGGSSSLVVPCTVHKYYKCVKIEPTKNVCT